MDQATGLRQLVGQNAENAASDAAPQVFVLSGGKGGVGVTTLAVNLAVALAEQGQRTVLLDAGLYRGDVATMCGLEERGSVADVLAARREIHEVLQPGPAGIQVVPGLWAPRYPADFGPAAQERLFRQIRRLANVADVVVIDAGNGGSDIVRHFWEAAHQVLLVTTTDPIAVMDSYATVKRLTNGNGPAIRLLVNRAEDQLTAGDVHRRVHSSARRFLGLEVDSLGFVPDDPCVVASTKERTPVLLHSPRCPAAEALMRTAARMMNAPSTETSNSTSPRTTVALWEEFEKTIELQPSVSPIG